MDTDDSIVGAAVSRPIPQEANSFPYNKSVANRTGA